MGIAVSSSCTAFRMTHFLRRCYCKSNNDEYCSVHCIAPMQQRSDSAPSGRAISTVLWCDIDITIPVLDVQSLATHHAKGAVASVQRIVGYIDVR